VSVVVPHCDQDHDYLVALSGGTVTTPPDFGGLEIEEGVDEDLGAPRAKHPVDHHDDAGSSFDDNEAHAVGKVCALCGAVIAASEDSRHRADGRWVHEACPVI
jgi:hypothetical protein